MSPTATQNTGSIYIGIDFGMALTKVAAQIRVPLRRDPIRVIVELPDVTARTGLAPHIPSTVWIADNRAYAFRADQYPQPTKQEPPPPRAARGLAGLGQMLMSFMSPPASHAPTNTPPLADATPADGIKAALLQEWSGAARIEPRFQGATASELVTIKIALVLAHARRSIHALAEREAPGCHWNTFVTCAVPLSGDASREQRLPPMQRLVERALAYSKEISDPSVGISLVEARHQIAELVTNPPWPADRSPVRAAPESLAAALFHLQRDGQTEGNWLTVDVGGLTTDTTLFFCNPEYEHLSYYAFHSVTGGTASLADDLARATNGTVSDAHMRLSQDGQLNGPAMTQAQSLKDCVIGAMKTTAIRALGKVSKHSDLFTTQHPDGRVHVKPRWRVLILGGGTVHPAISAWISQWKYAAGYRESDPSVTVACGAVERSRLPSDIALLDNRANCRRISANLLNQTDEAILALAVGLAQPPWDLWEYSEARNHDPKVGPDWRGDEHYVGN